MPPVDDGADHVAVNWPAAGDDTARLSGTDGADASNVIVLAADQAPVASAFFARTCTLNEAPGVSPVIVRGEATFVSVMDDPPLI